MKQIKESKICSFTQYGSRLQLVRLVLVNALLGEEVTFLYQVRLNRKNIGTSSSEYEMRKLFSTYAQNFVLQLKIE